MHYTNYMHYTPPHKQFYQYGTPLRERFNSVYRQDCGKAAIAAMMLFVALAVSLLTRLDANSIMSPPGLPTVLGFNLVFVNPHMSSYSINY